MSTHDYNLANQVGSDARADLNLLFAAIVSNNSSATEPATMFAYMFWHDTSVGYLKQRNAANTAWEGVSVSQIKFPATQNPSADANTLDDYKEGTWTPVVTASSGAFTTVSANGFYTKIGNTYFVRGRITFTNIGTASGSTLVSMPATPNGDAVLTGREIAATGATFAGQLINGSATGIFVQYNNLFGIANGYVLIFSGSFNV